MKLFFLFTQPMSGVAAACCAKLFTAHYPYNSLLLGSSAKWQVGIKHGNVFKLKHTQFI